MCKKLSENALALKMSEPRSRVSENLCTFFLICFIFRSISAVAKKAVDSKSVSVCVCVYLLQTEYRNTHSTNKVRTFGLFEG